MYLLIRLNYMYLLIRLNYNVPIDSNQLHVPFDSTLNRLYVQEVCEDSSSQHGVQRGGHHKGEWAADQQQGSIRGGGVVNLEMSVYQL